MPRFTPAALHAAVKLISRKMGSHEQEAEEVADHLVRANLAGHDSHGVGMIPSYVRILKEGLLVPNQELKTVVDFGAVLVLDAQRGYGQRMAGEAVRRAIARARELGACALSLRNSAHIGRIGTYGEMAAREGMVFTGYVNVADHDDWQATFGGREARLGTNPFCTAVPGTDGPGMVLDMATTTIAFGKARVARNKGVPVPEGAIIDKAGNPTTDPTALVDRHEGALLAFGRHKGSGLAVMCEVMAGAIAGGQRTGTPKRHGIVNSMFATIVDTARLGDPAVIRHNVGEVARHVKSAATAPGFDEILVPGEPERRSAEQRRREGIEVDPTSWQQIVEAAEAVGVSQAELEQAMGNR
jgi:hydroxycarboxylate dehydrogenase B